MHRASIHRFPYSQKIRSWQKPQVLAVGRGDLAGARYHITRWRILGKVCLFSVILSSHPTSNHFAYISTMYPIGQVKAHFIVLKKQKKKKSLNVSRENSKKYGGDILPRFRAIHVISSSLL